MDGWMMVDLNEVTFAKHRRMGVLAGSTNHVIRVYLLTSREGGGAGG